MKPVYYICACGCRVPQDKIVQYAKSTNAVKVNRQRCPDHCDTAMGNVVDRIFECQACGKHFKACKSAEYCPDCRYKIKIEKNRAYAKQYYSENPEKYAKSLAKNKGSKSNQKTSMDLYDPDRWACVNRMECLTKYLDYACLPCKGCARYQLPAGYDLPVDMGEVVAA